jgi:hypothetical protein
MGRVEETDPPIDLTGSKRDDQRYFLQGLIRRAEDIQNEALFIYRSVGIPPYRQAGIADGIDITIK